MMKKTNLQSHKHLQQLFSFSSCFYSRAKVGSSPANRRFKAPFPPAASEADRHLIITIVVKFFSQREWGVFPGW